MGQMRMADNIEKRSVAAAKRRDERIAGITASNRAVDAAKSDNLLAEADMNLARARLINSNINLEPKKRAKQFPQGVQEKASVVSPVIVDADEANNTLMNDRLSASRKKGGELNPDIQSRIGGPNIQVSGSRVPGTGLIRLNATDETVSVNPDGKISYSDQNGQPIDKLSQKIPATLSNDSPRQQQLHYREPDGKVQSSLNVEFDDSISPDQRKRFLSLATPEMPWTSGRRQEELQKENRRLQRADIERKNRLEASTITSQNRKRDAETAVAEQNIKNQEILASLQKQYLEAEPGSTKAKTLEKRLYALHGKSLPKEEGWQPISFDVPANLETKTPGYKKTLLVNPNKGEFLQLTANGQLEPMAFPGSRREENIGTDSQEQGQPKAPQAAIDLLVKNPDLKDQFLEKYGYLPEGY